MFFIELPSSSSETLMVLIVFILTLSHSSLELSLSFSVPFFSIFFIFSWFLKVSCISFQNSLMFSSGAVILLFRPSIAFFISSAISFYVLSSGYNIFIPILIFSCALLTMCAIISEFIKPPQYGIIKVSLWKLQNWLVLVESSILLFEFIEFGGFHEYYYYVLCVPSILRVNFSNQYHWKCFMTMYAATRFRSGSGQEGSGTQLLRRCWYSVGREEKVLLDQKVLWC